MEKNKRIKRVLFLIVAIYILLLLFLAYYQVAKSTEIAGHSYNPRNWVDESKYQRGSIKDRNGKIIAQSKLDGEDNYYRSYEHGKLFSNITGYFSLDYGKTGLEQTYNEELLNLKKKTPIDGIKNMVIKDTEGKNLVTTVDYDLQVKAQELLKGHKGSIIVMNPRNGDIYAMYSSPGFDPNNVEENWDQLINDPDSSLLNRCTQGLYTPGSVIKIITAVAIMESDVNLLYQDNGSTTVDGYTINNFENLAHDEINMEWALVHSSNTYFVDKALEVGSGKMDEVFRKFMFGQQLYFDLPIEISTDPFEEGIDRNALAAAAYGQGTTLVTPLQMTLAISALANDGDMVQPNIVYGIEDIENDTLENINDEIKVISKVTTKEIANKLCEYMGTVVENYDTATTYLTSSGGKTGTAETASGLDHAWYVGFAPLDNPKYAVSVILEDSGTLGGVAAAPIGAKMLDEATNLDISN